MNIFVNARFLTQNISGVQRYAIEISKRLKQSLPEVVFLTPKNIIQNELAQTLNAKAFGRLTGHLWEQMELPMFIKKNSGREQYLLLNFSNVAPLMCRNNFVSLHDITFIKFASSYSFLFSTYYKLLIPRIIRRARHVFTVSETVKQELHEHFKISTQKISVTYNAIDARIFNTDDRNPQGEDETINSLGKYILAVSMFNPIKNLPRLISAFISANLDGVKLVIVGGHYKSFKKDKNGIDAQNRPDIIFLGRINDPKKINLLYRKAQAFVFPSLYESFGIPPLEAMASGCPTIVSKAGALPEVCGDATCYVDPYDVNSIASAIKKLLSDNSYRNNLILLGKQQAAKYDWQNAVEVILQKIKDFEALAKCA